MTTTYDFAATAADGSEVSLGRLRGQGPAHRQRRQQVRADAAVRGVGVALPGRQGPRLRDPRVPLQPVQGAGTGQRTTRSKPSARRPTTSPFRSSPRSTSTGRTLIPLYEFLRAQAPGDFGPQYGDFYKAISNIRPEADGHRRGQVELHQVPRRSGRNCHQALRAARVAGRHRGGP